MTTITASKLKKLLDTVPNNTPIYIDCGDDKGYINNISIEATDERDFSSFEIKIDYET